MPYNTLMPYYTKIPVKYLSTSIIRKCLYYNLKERPPPVGEVSANFCG